MYYKFYVGSDIMKKVYQPNQTNNKNFINNRVLNDEAVKQLLINAQKGSRKAQERIIKNYENYIKSIIWCKFFYYLSLSEDLLQIGRIAISKCISKYNFSFNNTFLSYISKCIIGEIKNYLRDKYHMIRVPQDLMEFSIKVYGALSQMEESITRDVAIKRLSEFFNKPKEKIEEALKASQEPLSLDYMSFRVVEEGNRKLYNILGSLDKKLESIADNVPLYDAINELTPQCQYIIMEKYFNSRTQAEIAESLGVSQNTVSRREREALASLEESLFDIAKTQESIQKHK